MYISKTYYSKSNIHDCYCGQCWRKISVLLISNYFNKSDPDASIRWKPNSVSKLCLTEYVDLDNIQRTLKIQTQIYYLNIFFTFFLRQCLIMYSCLGWNLLWRARLASGSAFFILRLEVCVSSLCLDLKFYLLCFHHFNFSVFFSLWNSLHSTVFISIMHIIIWLWCHSKWKVFFKQIKHF